MIDTALPLAKYLQFKRVRIYDAVFVLHSKCTVVLVLSFTMLLSAKQYFGTPIQCISDLKFMDFTHSFCWTMGSFLVPVNESDPRNAISVGVGPVRHRSDGTIEQISLRYYQWVVIVLLLESVIFYLPAYLWKIWEGKRLDELCSPVATALIPQAIRLDHCHILTDYFNSDNRLVHRNYVVKYITCELLNMIVSISNILFLDYFLNGFWSRYLNVISAIPLNDWQTWDYRASQVFPKLAMCIIRTYGAGGSQNKYDALCMLPLNILNEKVFGFLWIWYTFLFLLAFLKILYRCLIFMCAPLRAQLLFIRVRSMSYHQVCQIVHNRTLGDWFILHKVSLNVNPLFMCDLLKELYQKSTTTKYTAIC